MKKKRGMSLYSLLPRKNVFSDEPIIENSQQLLNILPRLSHVGFKFGKRIHKTLIHKKYNKNPQLRYQVHKN